jgi:hypothetical protein
LTTARAVFILVGVSRWLLAASLVVACGSNDAAPSKPAEKRAAPAPLAGPTLTTEPVTLPPGGERTLLCESFPLENDDTLFVDGVTFSATGVHHSSWFALPESAYPGPSGSADCSEFGFGFAAPDSETSPTGGLLFAQSPQATNEKQVYGDGAAFAVAPHSQLFVSYHVINTSAEPLDVGISAAVSLLPRKDVKTRLTAGGGLIGLLSLPPASKSQFYSECAFQTPPTFKSYFMQPHYHQYGTGMRLELMGGDRDGEVVWQNEGSIGEALGSHIEPAVDFTGATGMRFSCFYENPTARTIVGGATASDEMCVFYLVTDAPSDFYAVATPGFGSPTLVDHGMDGTGEHVFSIDGCGILSL